MSKYGTCVVELHDGLPVVIQADPRVLVSNELLQDLPNTKVKRDGDDITFGTSSRGLGEVTYRIVGEEFEMDAKVAERIA